LEIGSKAAALARMPNPQLEQFTHALMLKVVPVAILASVAGLLLREFLNWVERRATRGIQSRKAQGQSVAGKNPEPLDFELEDTPQCPSCNTAMVKRKARRAGNAGEQFWGCSNFPKCRATRAI
jgi:hypothetical protein